MLVLSAMNAIICIVFIREAWCCFKKDEKKNAFLFLVGAVFFAFIAYGCFCISS